jgi:uncharacterized protein (TIGR00290 family)
MNQKKKAVFNWSGGKDSALALQKTIQNNEFDVVSLLTTINEETLTSSIHAIPVDLLAKQADSIGIPLYTVLFSKDLANYDDKIREAVEHFKKQDVTHFIFGDIFLADIKTYRESKLNPLGIEVVEPLWNKTSAEIIAEFIQSGIKSKIIVTQADKLDKTFIGKDLDENTINTFPGDVDVCGENGEYHTFSYSGDVFKKQIEFSILQTIKISYDMNLDNGQTKTFKYWQAEIV